MLWKHFPPLSFNTDFFFFNSRHSVRSFASEQMASRSNAWARASPSHLDGCRIIYIRFWCEAKDCVYTFGIWYSKRWKSNRKPSLSFTSQLDCFSAAPFFLSLFCNWLCQIMRYAMTPVCAHGVVTGNLIFLTIARWKKFETIEWEWNDANMQMVCKINTTNNKEKALS